MTDSPRTLLLMVEPEAQSGMRNMAIDEFLLETAIESGLAAVRIYRWNTATVSLGYFQDADEFRASGALSKLPAVRRLSGGGAILHDREVTYSCALPAGTPLLNEPSQVYGLVHDAILDVLHQLGISAGLRGDHLKPVSEPFLCFVRGDRHDIVCDGRKIVGSAQRRRRGAVLQHGSVLLAASPHAPQIPGLAELTPGTPLPSELPSLLGTAISQRLADELEVETNPVALWPGDAEARIAQLIRDRYEKLDWRSSRS